MSLVRSLRSRLTALFVGGAAITLLGASLGMNALVEQAVWGPLDAELGEEAETACTLLETASLDDVRGAVAAIAREPAPGPAKFMRISNTDGVILAHGGRVPAGLDERGPARGTESRTVRVPGDRRPVRVVWYVSGSACRALVGAGAEHQARTLRRARVAIAGAASGLLVLLAVLAWTITGRATAELGRLSDEVETIEAGSLARRLAPRHTLEVDRLATVLNRLLERLEGAMTHLRRFTADAAHELRTPIAGLRARLEGTLGGPRTAGAYHDGLLDSLEQAERLGSLAEHLLALSAVEARLENGPGEPVRVDALAREVAESLEPVAQEQGRRFDCVALVPVTVQGSPQLLKRVLLNLVDNAFRHTPHSSPVRLAVSAEGATAVVEISDAGPGMPPEEVARAFDRFHRGTGASAGGGLGLALCREIVAQHRGRIALRSERTSGTTVTVELPL